MSDFIEKQAAIDAIGLTTWAGSRVSKLPTVEAIPIVWIEQWIATNCYDKNGHYNGEGYDTVEAMLEDWRKEND